MSQSLRALGTTELRVSPLGLGTVKLGRTGGVKYPRPYSLPSDAEATALLNRASELGINLVDTAPAYGLAEERLGRLLEGRRFDWIIATKAGEEFDPGSGTSRFDFSAGAVTASVERSLRRLRTDFVDIVLLHSDGRDEWVLRDSGGLDALERLKEQGKTKTVGISTKTVAGGLAAVHSGRCDVLMVTYNPRDTAERVVIDAAAARGIGVLVKKALLSGHVGAAAEGSHRTRPDECLTFALAPSGVSSVIVGTINPDHLAENVRAALAALAGS